MWRRLLIVGLILVPVALIWGLLSLPDYMTSVHQRSVTQSLSVWKVEYSKIESQHDAVRAAEMLEYVQGYYVPAEGSRSTPEIEAALESQRQDTIDAFVASLREYTNEDFGEDSEKWLAHLEPSESFDLSRDEMSNISKLVDALSAEHNLEEARAALSELFAGGKKSFPVLLNRLDDETVTHIEFLGSVSTTDPPSIGQICFEILQNQIEGRWLKGFRKFRILDQTNISQWIKGHSAKSLTEMREIALTQAIQKVESQSEDEIEPKYAEMILSFLRDKKSFIDEPDYDFGMLAEDPFDNF